VNKPKTKINQWIENGKEGPPPNSPEWVFEGSRTVRATEPHPCFYCSNNRYEQNCAIVKGSNSIYRFPVCLTCLIRYCIEDNLVIIKQGKYFKDQKINICLIGYFEEAGVREYLSANNLLECVEDQYKRQLTMRNVNKITVKKPEPKHKPPRFPYWKYEDKDNGTLI